jgi:glycosyl transferase family 87
LSVRKWWRVAFAAICIVWFLQKLHWSDPGNLWDFTVYYHSVQAWRAGLDPYDTASLPPALSTAGFKFNYPPYALVLFEPFALLPLPRAMLVYLVLKLIALGWLVRIWSRLLQTSLLEPPWILFLLFAYSSAMFIDFVSGNVTTFEQLLLWLGVTALLKERYWPYVAAVVAASLLRITLIPLLLACLVAPGRRGYGHVAGGVAAFASIFLVTYLVAPQLTVEFFQSIPKNFGESGRLNPSLMPLVHDVSTLARRVYDAPLMPAIELGLYALLAAAIVAPTMVMARRVAGTTAVNRNEVIVYLLFLAYALALPRFKNYSYMLLIAPTYYIATRSTHLRQAVPLLLIACLPVYSWVTRPEHIALVANYSQWLIALGAWFLYLYEIEHGTLLEQAAHDARRVDTSLPSLSYR